MKYKKPNTSVPQEKRQEYNGKISALVSSGSEIISKQDIYNAFTGKGGLHGLNRSDFPSYYAYSAKKKEKEQGQFFTPHDIARDLISLLTIKKDELVIDPTCGAGVFFNFIPEEKNACGMDIDSISINIARHLYPQASLNVDDFSSCAVKKQFDFVVGNPPFNLRWEKTPFHHTSSQDICALKSATILKPYGLLAIITPATWLEDDYSQRIRKDLAQDFNFIGQSKIADDAFCDMGCKKFPTKMIVFQRLAPGVQDGVIFKKEYLSYNDLKTACQTATTLKRSAKARLVKSKDIGKLAQDRITKLLYDISASPNKSSYIEASCLYDKYLTQPTSKPEDISHEEWAYLKIEIEDVIKGLKEILSSKTHKPLSSRSGLHRNKYSIFLDGEEFKTFDIASGKVDIEFGHFNKALKRQRQNYLQHSIGALDKRPTHNIENYLEGYRFNNKYGQQSLRPMQKADLEIAIARNYFLLSWSPGSGKTAAAHAWMEFKRRELSAKKVIVIAPALAAHTTWSEFFNHQNQDFCFLKNLNQEEEFLTSSTTLISISNISKLQKIIKRTIKKCNNKVVVVFDESDEISNNKSIRTKAILDCFRRLPILLTTGTSTRNCISEFYPQLELMANNSFNMLNESESLYREDKKGNIKESINTHKNKPFSAKSGQEHFRQSFNPQKTSVFGVSRNTQAIMNPEVLEMIGRRFSISRSLEEVKGEKPYEIETVHIKPFGEELNLYRNLVKDLDAIIPEFFNTDDTCSKKTSMLRIIRQLNLMIKACTLPESFKDFDSDRSSKREAIISRIGKHNGTVAIGLTSIEAAKSYANCIQLAFPSRRVHYIDGGINFIERKKITSIFDNSIDDILICTQQSLASSINIPNTQLVILDPQWNVARMNQFFYRFCRLDGTNTKIEIFILANSIEANICQLLVLKEQGCRFLKDYNYQAYDNVVDELGIDASLFESVLRQVHDKSGKRTLQIAS